MGIAARPEDSPYPKGVAIVGSGRSTVEEQFVTRKLADALKAILALDAPLMQRVAVKCRLSSLNPEMSKAYILHRLKVAGATREIFPEAVLDQVAVDSRGIPRLINTICDNVLLEGFLRKREKLDVELVKDVVIAGNLFQTMDRIDRVAGDFQWNEMGGGCGKGGQVRGVERRQVVVDELRHLFVRARDRRADP